MIAVINAGGEGSRLWPLSTPEYPKHLLYLGNNDGLSLIQSTHQRAKSLADSAYVITEKSHAHHIEEQLSDIDASKIVIEPARRGTASCLLLALERIAKEHDPDEPIVFMHADHVIHDTDAFKDSVNHAGRVSSEHNQIVLLGVEPTYPSTGFGYIEKGSRASERTKKDVFEVASFKEKPERKIAEQYLKAGHYLWNMGYFVASINTFKNTMKDAAPNLFRQLESLEKAGEDKKDSIYESFENAAIDYALLETTNNLFVIPGNFDWIDIGSYQDLHTVAHQDANGNVNIGDIKEKDVTNSYLRNDTDHPIAVVGLDNVVVVHSKNGLIVANRTHAQDIGDIAKQFTQEKD